MHGQGKLYWTENQPRYQGEFENGEFHGHGVEYAKYQIAGREDEIDESFVRLHEGSWIKYEGKFLNDKRHGAGKAYFRKGTWIGNFQNGQPNGEGMFVSSDKQKFRGIWRNGKLEKMY